MRLSPTLALCLLASLGACSDPEVAVYKAPKDAAAAPGPAMPASAGSPKMDVERPGLAWSTPPGWRQQAGSGMRLATLLPPADQGQAELSVVQLAGDAGGDLANVNRWRGQLGLAPVASVEDAQRLATPAGQALVVELEGKAGQAMTAAILKGGVETWFFKLTGPTAAVAQARPGFAGFLESLRHVP